MVSLLHGHICDSHRTRNNVFSRYPQFTHGNDVEHPKEAVKLAKNPQQIPVFNELAAHEGLDQDSIFTEQWNLTVLVVFIIVSLGSKHTHWTTKSGRPPWSKRSRPSGRSRLEPRRSSRSQRCIYKNSIKPLTLKLFHHTFRQLKV